MKLDVKVIRDQIMTLLAANPELEEDDVLRADMIEGETEAFAFLSRLVRAAGEAKIMVAGLAAYMEMLKQRHDRHERRIEVLRQFIKQVMDAAQLRKAELPEATLSIRIGQPKVLIINEHEIPVDYMRIKKEPDKTKIKAALIAGGHVMGTALSNSEPTLAIIIR